MSSTTTPKLIPEDHEGDSSDDSAERFLDVAGDSSSPSSNKEKVSLAYPKQQEQQQSSLFSKLDKFLANYVKYTSSGANQDKCLKVLQWSTWLASYYLAKQHKNNNKSSSKALAKMSIHLSFVRYALRLFGLPESVDAIRNNTWGSSPYSKIMAWSMVLYYPLEHVAYWKWISHDSNNTTGLTTNRHFSAEKLSAWSCRAWLVYLVAEVVQSLFKLKDMKQTRNELMIANKEGDDHDQEDKQEQLETIQASIYNEWLQVSRSLLFTLPAIHWSLPKWDTDPWLKEPIVNGLMWIEAMLSMYQSLVGFTPAA